MKRTEISEAKENIEDLLKGKPFILAPLAGITDSAFRLLCKEQGSGMSYTEMVSIKGLYYGSAGTEKLLAIRPGEGDVGIQLFGSEPEMFALAGEKLEKEPNILFDINMGCPVPKVVNNGEGAALLKNPKLAERCVKALSSSTRKPVTVKMRIGFEKAEPEKSVDFALAMQEAGAAAIAVHARSRSEYYSGKADWDAIARIKEALSIPVIGNGDVFSAEDGIAMFEKTSCDAVMVARGALGNPWIFRELNAAAKDQPVPARPGAEEIKDMIRRHLALAIGDKGEYAAVRQMRKHICWYVSGLRGAAAIRRLAVAATTAEEVEEVLQHL